MHMIRCNPLGEKIEEFSSEKKLKDLTKYLTQEFTDQDLTKDLTKVLTKYLTQVQMQDLTLEGLPKSRPPSLQCSLLGQGATVQFLCRQFFKTTKITDFHIYRPPLLQKGIFLLIVISHRRRC